MANTLDLDPEWGAINLIEEVEEAFGIKIADHEAERCWTVGDLYDVICSHTPQWDDQGGSCASSAVFYSLRRSLAPEDKAAISPRSPLHLVGVPPGRLFKSLRRDSGLRLPSVQSTTIGMIGAWTCLVGVVIGLGALFAGAWTFSGIGALLVAVGVLLLRTDPARLPDGVATVGDLARRTVPLNVRKLADSGARPPDRWTILVALTTERSFLPPDRIEPDTFLMRKGMELAAAQS